MMIDLGKLSLGEARVISGRQRGVAARALFGLTDGASIDEEMVVAVPERVLSVAPSFVQGLFAGVTKDHGVDRIRSRLKLDGLRDGIVSDFETGFERLRQGQLAH